MTAEVEPAVLVHDRYAGYLLCLERYRNGDRSEVNDEKNGRLYAEYKKLADAEDQVIFGGRLGEYQYYDMDATIASVLEKCEEVFV